MKITVPSVENYNYLVFYGKKLLGHGQPTVYVYNDQYEKAAEITAAYPSLDDEWHQYVIDITNLTGEATIIFNGGYIDKTGNPGSAYVFSDITLY